MVSSTSCSSAPSACPNAFLSIAVVYEHVPWLSYYARLLPWAGKDLKTMRKMAFDRAALRYTQGSSAKDLFYYLVRPSPTVSDLLS